MRTLLGSLAIAATVAATIGFIPEQASAERVCRQDCVGPVCKERCVESSDRDRDQSKYPPAEPGALGSGPLEAAVGVADAAPIL
jgi:hypothetical protein